MRDTGVHPSLERWLTITLTTRPPVRVDKMLWPVIASARVDRYRMTVRQHASGASVVYGVYTDETGHEVRFGRLAHRRDLGGAIVDVGLDLDAPEALARECMSSLPVVDL